MDELPYDLIGNWDDPAITFPSPGPMDPDVPRPDPLAPPEEIDPVRGSYPPSPY